MQKFIVTINEGSITVQCGNTTISGTSWRDLEAEAASLCAEISRDIAVYAASPDDMDEVDEILHFAEKMGN